MVNSLLLATVVRTALIVVSYGCKVPCGIFVPSMAVGAYFGRMIGILVKAMHTYILTFLNHLTKADMLCVGLIPMLRGLQHARQMLLVSHQERMLFLEQLLLLEGLRV